MPLGTIGLSTWRWNNNLKSILILLAFPVMLLVLLWAIVVTSAYFLAGPQGVMAPDLAQAFDMPPQQLLPPLLLAQLTIMLAWPWVLGVAALWTGVGYFFHESFLRSATGSRPIERTEQPRLYNIMENLCIARGMQMPKLYIIDTPELNAFASGISPGNFTITATSGILEALNDAELEAVLAHELTHIINRDVRLLVVTVVFAGMISFLAHMMWRSMQMAQYRSDRRDNRGFIVIVVAGVFLLIGNFLALILRLALSRRREYLADAGAVDITHNPEAMIGALRKIAGHADMPNVPTEVRQMFIENPPGFASFFNLFSTHPRIEDRIAILEKLTGTAPVTQGHSHIPSTND